MFEQLNLHTSSSIEACLSIHIRADADVQPCLRHDEGAVAQACRLLSAHAVSNPHFCEWDQRRAERGSNQSTVTVSKMPLTFLDLPAEIREQIYFYFMWSSDSKRFHQVGSELPPYYEYDLSLLYVNRLVHTEAKKIFQDNIFIKITTPWPQSIQHINNEGKVPIVAEGSKAAAFKQYHLHIFVDTPDPAARYYGDTVSMLTCLEDLPAFSQMWRYSNLNYRGELNLNLTLKLTIQDPHVQTRKLPKKLQEQLLVPFGEVKGLAKFSLEGTYLLPSVEKKITELRAQEEPAVESCLASAEALKNEGNTKLAAGKYQEAIDFYIKSFAAIHIEVNGRIRNIHCDGYFQTDLASGPDKGKRADYMRMIIRVRLVANIVFAYLKLKEYAEAHFWGKRSIVLFRQSMTGDNVDDVDWLEQLKSLNWPAQTEMGKIFYRTALAAREMRKEADVKTLIKAASVYLPHDETVQREKAILEEQERSRAEQREQHNWSATPWD